jgi:hypothetical protein
MFEPEATAHPRRMALKDDAWPTAVVVPAKPKTHAFRAVQKAPLPVASPAATREEGSCDTADQCALLLRVMVDDPTRNWIALRPSAAVYANGTRAFAFQALKARLTCRELDVALDDFQAADRSLIAGIGSLGREQVERVRALNARVSEDLRAEQVERCERELARPTG